MVRRRPAETLDEAAWVEAALELLLEVSIEKVGVEPLAKKLGVTKGSFYWHFKDRAALHDAMLRTWKQRATLAIIQRVEQSESSPLERLKQMVDLPYRSKTNNAARIELAIRAWARKDERAANAVAEVDEQRLTFFVGLLKSIGYDDLEASARAYLIYSYNFASSLIVTSDSPANKRLLASRRERASHILIGL